MNKQKQITTRQKQTCRYREQTGGERGMERGR